VNGLVSSTPHEIRISGTVQSPAWARADQLIEHVLGVLFARSFIVLDGGLLGRSRQGFGCECLGFNARNIHFFTISLSYVVIVMVRYIK
jgi:hypothetical protein